MAGFSGTTAIHTAIENGQSLHSHYHKFTSGTGPSQFIWRRFWNQGGLPIAGAEPASSPGTVYDSAVGGITFPDRGAFSKFLATLEVRAGNCMTDVSLMVMDRLAGVGAVAVTSTGTKTLNSSSLSRYTTGAGVEVWVEVTTATSGSVTLSLSSYTNQDGVSGRVGPPITFAAVAAQAVFQLPLQAGDTGARSVEQLDVATAPGAGIINVVQVKPLDFIGLANLTADSSSSALEIDGFYQRAAMQRVYDLATITFYGIGLVTVGAVSVTGSLSLIYG